MPTLTLYPTSTTNPSLFTQLQLDNVIGNTATYCVHSAYVTQNAGMGGRIYFQMTDIPAASVVSAIRAKVIAKCSSAGYRAAYSLEMYDGGGPLVTINTALTTSDATYTHDMPLSGWSTSRLRNNSIEWNYTFSALLTGTVTTSWQKFFLEIDYELIADGPSTLFINELF